VCQLQTQNKIFTDPESERDNPRTREPERGRREAQQILLVAMEVDDVFIRLVEEARASLLLHQQQQLQLQQEKKRKQQQQEPSWAWVCMRLLSCCSAYPSGVTPAILLSDLFQVGFLGSLLSFLSFLCTFLCRKRWVACSLASFLPLVTDKMDTSFVCLCCCRMHKKRRD
jgi:hypothetical protein